MPEELRAKYLKHARKTTPAVEALKIAAALNSERPQLPKHQTRRTHNSWRQNRLRKSPNKKHRRPHNSNRMRQRNQTKPTICTNCPIAPSLAN